MSQYGFGNLGHYRGQTLNEYRQSIEAGQMHVYRDLVKELVDIIGEPAFDTFIDEIWHDGMTWAEASELIRHKLDLYECAGDPPDGTCGGCLRRAEAVRLSCLESSTVGVE